MRTTPLPSADRRLPRMLVRERSWLVMWCSFVRFFEVARGLRRSAWRDGDDHIALLVTQVDVAMRLHDLIQRVAAVDHRPKRAALGELLKRQKVRLLGPRERVIDGHRRAARCEC